MKFGISADDQSKALDLIKRGKHNEYLAMAIAPAKAIVEACGVAPANAQKIFAHLAGSLGSRLGFPAEFWMTPINRWALGQPEDPAQGHEIGDIKAAVSRLSGHIVLPYDGKQTTIKLDDKVEYQQLFALLTKKKQGVGEDGTPGIMNSISVLCFDTVENCKYPLGLLIDASVDSNGKINPSFSYTVYRPLRNQGYGANQTKVREDRLKDLQGLYNLPQYALQALVDSGAPVFENARTYARNGNAAQHFQQNQNTSNRQDDEELVVAGDQFATV